MSQTRLAPGDTVLLRRGGSFPGGLTVRGSGTSSAYITIGAYGTGARPVVYGNAEACISLPTNHVKVSDLQVGVTTDAGRCRWAGNSVSGDHNKILSNHITGAGAGIFIAPSAQYTEVTQNDLVDNNQQLGAPEPRGI